MTEKRRFLDVWIIESNTVYREVPFSVVADWVQQGRLLEDDMLRPSGTAEWFRVGGSPEFATYVPRVRTVSRGRPGRGASNPSNWNFTGKSGTTRTTTTWT